MGVSVVINTLNEERNIRACLETVTWADEIIIVDMHSDDDTFAIAREFTDQVFLHERVGYVEPARNFAIKQATQDWILVLDADERVTPELHMEIRELANRTVEESAFAIWIQEYQFGKFLNHTSFRLQKNIRLLRHSRCTWLPVVHSRPIVDGTIGELESSIKHYSHLTVENYLSKLNRYTELEANERFAQGIRRPLWKAFYRGLGKFIKELIYYQGWKDGGHGWLSSALYGIYYFISEIKLWELWYKHDHGLLTPESNDSQTRLDLQSKS
jgi:glycosyltransferase involved in cell wall biosynthesis